MRDINHGFTMWKKKGVRYMTIPSFNRAGGVVCAMSTRIGGVSPKPYDTLNFSTSREKNRENFIENFRRYGQSAGFDYTKAIANNYEHGPNVILAKKEYEGCGITRENLKENCDGLYTDIENLPLVTFHADCVPLYFYDPNRRAAAICHAGWKGVSQHIIKNAVSSLENLGCSRENILAAVGPCISAKHFEVQSDVYEVYDEVFGSTVLQKRDGSVYVDLPKACVLDMTESGLLKSNITLSDLCTYEHKRFFFSHRRDKGQTGAMAAVIMLKS